MHLKFRRYTFIIIAMILLHGCKKTKLEGEYFEVAGSWVWSNGFNDAGNTNFNLILKRNGKYELNSGGKTLDKGVLQKKDGYLQFNSNLFRYKRYLDLRNVKYFTEDSLIITRVHFTDQPVSYYKKKK